MNVPKVLARALGVAVRRSVSTAGWLSMLRTEVLLVSGRETSSQLPLTIVCAVSNFGKNRNYILQRIFGDNFTVRRIGRRWIWDLEKIAASNEAALLVAELRQSLLGMTRVRDWLFVPTWVWGEIQLPRRAEAVQKVSGDMRRIRRHGLTGEVTHDVEHFDDFYHNMYVPYVRGTFGACAGIASYRNMRSAFGRGGLLIIRQGDQVVAGQIIVNYGPSAALENMGIRNGDRQYVQQGAGCALYHYGLQHFESQGITRAGVGWSRPSLHDGVLKFKRKWSQRIIDCSARGFAFRVYQQSAAVRALLGSNPFVCRRDGQYYAAVFTDQPELQADEVRQMVKDYLHDGLAHLEIFCLGAEQPDAAVVVPEDCAAVVRIRGAADLPGLLATERAAPVGSPPSRLPRAASHS